MCQCLDGKLPLSTDLVFPCDSEALPVKRVRGDADGSDADDSDEDGDDEDGGDGAAVPSRPAGVAPLLIHTYEMQLCSV